MHRRNTINLSMIPMTLPISFSAEQVAKFTPAQRAQALKLVNARGGIKIWYPLEGPQKMAYTSKADIIGYGGAAGGGKTDLACGKALTQHQTAMILRREGTQLTGIIDRLTTLLKGRDGYNGQEKIWRLEGKQIEFGSTPNPGDETKYQGRPHDLLVFDETTNFLEQQVRFLLGWLRSVDPNQVCQALMCFNPPTTVEGRWIIQFFAPWLDKKYPNPAAPGELRWCASVNGEDTWVDDNRKFVLVNGEITYEFDPKEFLPEDIITPLSRTFIPSRVSDNPYLYGTGYMSTLQSLPEPLRSQMLYGDFNAGVQDDEWQVIPTAWVEASMAKWKEPVRRAPMQSMGIDVARGGKDNTIIARLHEDEWFDVPLVYPGEATPNGPKVAGLTIAASRDNAVQHIDVIGVGSSPYDFLVNARQPVVGVNVSEKATGTDQSGRLRFKNQRSQWAWKMREALDPDNNTGLILPPDKKLLADLCALTWELQGSVIYVHSREEIYDKIKRSADYAWAYIYALIKTPKTQQIRGMGGGAHNGSAQDYDPYAGLNR